MGELRKVITNLKSGLIERDKELNNLCETWNAQDQFHARNRRVASQMMPVTLSFDRSRRPIGLAPDSLRTVPSTAWKR